MTRKYNQTTVTIDDIREKAKSLSNWNKWGDIDECGSLNYITQQQLVRAASLVRRGKVFALGMPFDTKGPQEGLWGNRWNPIHTMLATGTDAVCGAQDSGKLRYADDAVSMPLQCGTQWDALSHIFFDDKMWNGYDATLVDSDGALKNGIEKVCDKMVGRGVLLDIARDQGVRSLDDGEAITNQDLDGCATRQKVDVCEGDFVIVRTGQLEERLESSNWRGFAGGDAPGLAFETCEWIHDNRIAGICADTWGCEVRPNESTEASQPWHWVVIPMMGVSVGEMFYLKDLSSHCAAEGVYEFMFVAPPLPITGAVGSPVNPIAIL